MEYYVWKYGPSAERSVKAQNQHGIALQEGKEFYRSTASAVGVDNETIDKIEIALQMAEHTQGSTRKENVNNKLHERHMVQQVNQNPYFQGSDYMHDLDIQEAFLRPRASNSELKGID